MWALKIIFKINATTDVYTQQNIKKIHDLCEPLEKNLKKIRELCGPQKKFSKNPRLIWTL